MAKYRKRCFYQIDGVIPENKALTAEVDRLRLEAEKEAKGEGCSGRAYAGSDSATSR